MSDETKTAAQTCKCGKPATLHVKIDDTKREYACTSHRRAADDWHDIADDCLHPQHDWVFGRCTVLTATENAIVDILDAISDEDASPLVWLSPENEYYGIEGLHVWYIEQLAQIVARAAEPIRAEERRKAAAELDQLRRDRQEDARRIEELERQRDAVLALCDEAMYESWGEEFGGSHSGHCIERDEIRAIYGAQS